jgi:hypothetical protein
LRCFAGRRTPLDGVLLLDAAMAPPSSCVLAGDDPDSPKHPPSFVDTALAFPGPPRESLR